MKKISKQEEVKKPSTKKTSNKVLQSINGLLLLLAVASIFYSTTVILMGTEGVVPIIMVAPQTLLAVGILIIKFVK